MAVVHIHIGGREYDIACDDGQEEHLRFLADEVDDRIRALIFGMGSNPGEGMSLLLTALTMLPAILMSVTPFLRSIVVLHFHADRAVWNGDYYKQLRHPFGRKRYGVDMNPVCRRCIGLDSPKAPRRDGAASAT